MPTVICVRMELGFEVAPVLLEIEGREASRLDGSWFSQRPSVFVLTLVQRTCTHETKISRGSTDHFIDKFFMVPVREIRTPTSGRFFRLQCRLGIRLQHYQELCESV